MSGGLWHPARRQPVASLACVLTWAVLLGGAPRAAGAPSLPGPVRGKLAGASSSVRSSLVAAAVVPEELAVSPDRRTLAVTLRSADLLHDRVQRRIALLSLVDGLLRDLAVEGSNELPAWSPDGRSLAFVSDRERGRQLWCADVATGTQRRLTRWPLPGLGHPQWSADGARIELEAPTFPEAASEADVERLLERERTAPYRGVRVWAHLGPASAQPSPLRTHRFAVDPRHPERGLCDLTPGPADAAVWGALVPRPASSYPGPVLEVKAGGERALWMRAQAVGRHVVVRQVGRSASAPWEVRSGDWHVSALAGGSDDTAWFVGSSSADPPEIYAIEPGQAAPRCLTHLNTTWARPLALPRYRALFAHSTDGKVLPGFHLSPQQGTAAPLVLVLRGLPAEAAVDGWDETALLAQYLVAGGYQVLLADPRAGTDAATGRHRYLAPWCSLGAAGLSQARDDVAVWLRIAHDACGASPARVALLGEGGGGWLAGLLDPSALGVACTITVGAPFELSSTVLQSERPAYWSELLGGSWLAVRERCQGLSPQDLWGGSKVPHLVMHGAADPVVPLGEARAWYAALSQAGAPAKLLVFDDEGRSLGRPRNQEVRLTAAREWLARYLLVAGRVRP